MFSIFPHDREWLAPVALARKEPVAKFKLDAAFTDALLLQPNHHFDFCFLCRHAVERTAVHGVAFVGKALHRLRLACSLVSEADARFLCHDFANRQCKLLRKLPIALVVRRHSHDRAGAVAREHVVCDPHGDFLAVHRIDGKRACEYAGLFFRQFRALEVALARGGCSIRGDGFLLIWSRNHVHERMLGSEHHVSRPEKRIGSRGKNGHSFPAACYREMNFRSFAPPDPVALMHLDRIRPVETIELVDEPLRVCCDAEHPLTHRTPLYRETPDFRFAIHNLLVCQHRAELRAPIDWRMGNVGQSHAVSVLALVGRDMLRAIRRGIKPRVVELHEDPLRPFKIPGVRGVHLALPVVAEADGLELLFEVRHIGLRRRARVLAGLDCVLLRRQAERVPSHRMQHIETSHLFIPSDDVRRGVAFGMADVQALTARIREHIEHVVFRLRCVEAGLAGICDMESLPLVPDALPLGLKLVEWKRSASLLGAHKNVGAGR